MSTQKIKSNSCKISFVINIILKLRFTKMAESSDDDVLTSMELDIEDGHKLIYEFRFRSLNVDEKVSDELEYLTQCDTTPTLWDIERTWERVKKDGGSYIFLIKLRRMDVLKKPVTLCLHVAFLNANEGRVVRPIRCGKNEMVGKDELVGTANIGSKDIKNLVSVRATIAIEYCHSGMQSAAKANSQKNTVNKQANM